LRSSGLDDLDDDNVVGAAFTESGLEGDDSAGPMLGDDLIALGYSGTEDLDDGRVDRVGEDLQLHRTSSAFDDVDPHECHLMCLRFGCPRSLSRSASVSPPQTPKGS
jgi:hypothetical protein